MSLLKSVVSNIEKENLLEQKRNRQLRTNPNSIQFDVRFPVANKDCTNKELQNRLIKTIRSIGDVQKSTTNLQGSMTGWYMHESNPDFMEVCRFALKLAYENSPRPGVPLMPYDCWGGIYSKGDYIKTHEHWPSIWGFCFYVQSCEHCAPLIFDDAYGKHSVQPKSGNIFVFPGWVRHTVPKQKCDHDRVIVAGNLGINPWQPITDMESRGATDVSKAFKNMIHIARKLH